MSFYSSLVYERPLDGYEPLIKYYVCGVMCILCGKLESIGEIKELLGIRFMRAKIQKAAGR